MIRRYLPRDTEQLIQWYERYISPLSLIVGFLVDSFILLRRVDLWQSNALLLAYLLLASVGIAIINLIETGRLRHRVFLTIAPFVPVVVQFSFGALLSGFLSLYSRSAAFVGTWLFVAAVAVLMIGNERFRKLYLRYSFQISMLFASVFLFLIFFIPVVVHRIGPMFFVLSGGIALAVIVAFLRLLHRLVPEVEVRERRTVALSIAAIYLVINALYFSNAIPPLPLALKEAGVYHSVTRVGTEYRLEAEESPWYRWILPGSAVYHRAPGESAYAFSAIFAPSQLTTDIVHVWERYDETEGEWVESERVRFPIQGGRDGGYRGYSVKTDLAPGAWRVDVQTGYGQTIGRIRFRVEASASRMETETVVR